MLDAARGMGVGGFRMLWQIRLPIAWPVILAGIRVSAQLTVGIVAIAAFVTPVGLGDFGYSSLDNLGSVNTKNQALVCIIFVALVALAFDARLRRSSAGSPPRGGPVSESPATTPAAEHHDAAACPDRSDRAHQALPRSRRSAAVDSVNLEIPAGEIVVFVGPSGCGKTTTMRMINRLIEPTSGTIEIGGEDVTKLDDVKLRRRIGYVIQQIGLIPHLSIAQNVAWSRGCSSGTRSAYDGSRRRDADARRARPGRSTAAATRDSCPAASSSASASRGRWPPTRRSC